MLQCASVVSLQCTYVLLLVYIHKLNKLINFKLFIRDKSKIIRERGVDSKGWTEGTKSKRKCGTAILILDKEKYYWK